MRSCRVGIRAGCRGWKEPSVSVFSCKRLNTEFSVENYVCTPHNAGPAMVSRRRPAASRLACNGPVLKGSARHAPRRGPQPAPRASAQGCARPVRGERERGPGRRRGGGLLYSRSARRPLGSSLTASAARGQRDSRRRVASIQTRSSGTCRRCGGGASGPQPCTSGDSGRPPPPALLQHDGRTQPAAGGPWGQHLPS